MPSKKRIKKSGKPSKKTRNVEGLSRFRGSNVGIMLGGENGEEVSPEIEFDFEEYPHPIHPNPETPETREKRLSARKALTLKAFRIAYENSHRRKAS